MIRPRAPYCSRRVLRKLVRSLPRTGQSLIEFAFVFPLLVTIFFGVIELGVLFSVYVGLTNSAREGARAGSTYQYQCPPAPPGTPDCRANNPDLQQDVDDARLPVINQAIDATLHPMIESSALNRIFTYTPTAGTNVYRYGDQLNVALEYQHQLFFNLLGGPTIDLRSSSTMRIEPGGV